jgi:hypothetical protein
MDGATVATIRARAGKLARTGAGLSAEEVAVVGILERRLKKSA